MTGEADDRVTVRGRAERRVEADRADWTVQVLEQDSDETMAFDRAAARANVLMDAVREVVGEEGRVETGAVRIVPAWDDRHRERIGVEAGATLRVRTSAAAAGAAIRAAMSAGANRIDGPWFSVSDRDGVYEELLSDAVIAARRKAERVASAAGRTVGRALTIEEGEAVGLAPFRPQQFALAAAADVAAPEPEIAASEEVVAANVVVVFELVDDTAMPAEPPASP